MVFKIASTKRNSKFVLKHFCMSKVDIRQKLHDYIEGAPDKKAEAIYTMVEDEIENEEPCDHWEDNDFVAELIKEEEEYLNGTTKTYSLEEVAKTIKETIQNARAKKGEYS